MFDTYSFDHKGRLINTFVELDNHPQQHISQLAYTVKDQIARKSLGGTTNGFLQEVDYDYLENGYLSGINSTMSADDLFQLKINYDQAVHSLITNPSKNGNISQLRWKVKGKPEASYGYFYDYLDRVYAAIYGYYENANSNSLNFSNTYSTFYSYDARGNITDIQREGNVPVNTGYLTKTIDDLNLDYDPDNNHLRKVTDAAPYPSKKLVSESLDNTQMHAAGQAIIASNNVNDGASITFQAGDSIMLKPGFHVKAGASFTAKIGACPQSGFETEGFVQRSNDTLSYDANGNLIKDPNKGIEIAYNYHNLPYQVTFGNGNRIEWLYDASGKKWQKLVSKSATTILQQDYIDNIEYRNDTLEAVYLGDARLVRNGNNSLSYQYMLADHLGNNRVLFSDSNNDGSIDVNTEVLQENHYYPFGMEMKGEWNSNSSPRNSRLYNGKELDTDYGLDWYHYGARMYDPAIGRFTGVDPISDEFAWVSTYNYAENEPIRNIDLHGLQKFDMISNDPGLNSIKASKKERKQYQGTVNKVTGTGLAILGGAAGVARFGAARVSTFIANEVKDEVLSQATGGASDVLDVSKVATKGLRKLLEFDANSFDNAVEKIRDINKKFSDGTSKDVGGLESAVNSASYYSAPGEQAASLFNSMAGGHVFSNGNKRSASEFIKQYASDNGLKLNLNDEQLRDLTSQLANGTKMEISDLSKTLFKN